MATTTICGAALSTMAGLAVVAGVAAIPTEAFAQDYTSGTITGNVVDGSGKAIAGATVTATSNATGIVRSGTTSASGTFSLVNLPIGDYTVTVAAPGFTSETESQVVVEASKQTNFEFTLLSEGASASTSTGEVIVRGARRKLAFSTATTGIALDVEKLTKDVPVGRNLTSLVMMAPGTVQGDSAFGNLASVGGSSVAENAYYLNGMNITDFNNYLGSSFVPFEFFKSVDIKEGGQSAEFGRATGGIINAVTKSGSNEWKGAVRLNWSPSTLESTAPNTKTQLNEFDAYDSADIVAELGGPILKDHLYAFGIVQKIQTDEYDGNTSGLMTHDHHDNTFYGLKLDGYINPDHHLEFTYFDTSRTVDRTILNFDTTTGDIQDETGVTQYSYGAPSYVLKYTGRLTDWLTISAATGSNKDSSESVGISGSAYLPMVQDANYCTNIKCDPTSTADYSVFDGELYGNGQLTSIVDFPQFTERKFTRADVDVRFSLWGDHHVRAGWESEKNDLTHFATRTGEGKTYPRSYIYRRCAASVRCSTGSGAGLGLTPTSLYVELNHYNTGGFFKAENIGYYIQDEWKVNNKLTLNLGYRIDEFNNFTADGSQFIDFNGLGAPRVGFSYDPAGDGVSRFFGFYGTYYLPVASNTAFRQGSQEYYFREYWTYTGIDANGIPVLGNQLTGWTGGGNCPYGLESNSAGAGSLSCNVTGDGTVQDPTASISKNLKATQENEFLIGYERKINDLWTVGLTYLHRDLVTNAEDVAIDAAVNAYCEAEGITGCSSNWSGYHQYTIINPGEDSTIVLRDPINGETTLRTVTFTAEQLGYPKAERKYDAVEFSFKRAFDGVWSLSGSYTWSKSEGNSEGYVQSDFGQDDAGITQDFDQPGFTDYAYGELPNSRTHKFKAWGYYQMNEKLSFGTQVQIASPRKLSCFGYHPKDGYDNFENGYEQASHYCGGKPAPRGKGNETDWTYNFDVSARYKIPVGDGRQLTLRADIFNIFDMHGVTSRNEIGDLSNGSGNTPPAANPSYGDPISYQAPRYVRVGLDFEF